MNICKGLCYALFATLAILIVGLPISVVARRELGMATLHGKIFPYRRKQAAQAGRGKPYFWLGDYERQPYSDQAEAV